MTQFNYMGLNKPHISEITLKNIFTIEDKLRILYSERLKTFNKENLSNNPEPFRFLEKDNCSVVSFLLPFEFDRSRAMIAFLLSTPNQREEHYYVLSSEELSDIDSYEYWLDFFFEKILPLYGYDNSQIIMDMIDYYSNFELQGGFSLFESNCNHEQWIQNNSMNFNVINVVKTETSKFKEINKTPLSYFAKDAYKFPFSILDLKPLVELVKDDDFSYQLDQAMAAYHENLFLPCASTLGVVLETLCIKILEDNGIKRIKSGDTQLGRLRERLMNERIITRRDNTRLEVAYKMRNMASHSSPGVALKEDCHFMLNVINTIALEYLKVED